MNEIIYTEDELKDYSDQELLAILAKSWGVEDGKFEVWGQLPALGETTFGFLRNPYLVKTGERLYYPIQGHELEPCSFFVAPNDASRLGSKTKQRFVRCELELSPESERLKHKNPFGLCVKKGSGENLRFLPKEIPLSEDNEYNTLAGFILHELEDIPEENQEFNINDYHFKILKMNNKSVDLVQLIYEEPSIVDEISEEIGEL